MFYAEGVSQELTRYYIGGRYEQDIRSGGATTERLYLGGDAYSAPMVLVREGTGNWTPLNIGRDYLGSVTHIVTADGTLVAEYSYDPWGRLRDPETHEIYAPGTEPTLCLGRGFTGHEHLPWFGLINMNARLYDPLLCRFLSPDPYVQTPDFTQSFNRYAYGLNNPLSYTDPNGEFVLTATAVALIIGAAVGLAAGMYSGYKIAESKGATGWKMAGYMLGGGLIGGIAGLAGGYVGAAVGAGIGIGGALGGAISGFYGGFVSGGINGFGMNLLAGGNFGTAIENAGRQSIIGGVMGAVLGGLIQGVASAKNGCDFWNGKPLQKPEMQQQNYIETLKQETEGLPPYEKGQKGVEFVERQITDEGGEILEHELTLKVNGTRVRVDMAAKIDNQLTLIEVKTGAHAGFTKNQSIVYPQMMLNKPVIYPQGKIAPSVIHDPTNDYQFIIIKFNF